MSEPMEVGKARLHAVTDDDILRAIGDGARTASIADRLMVLRFRPAILRRLKRLQADGRVAIGKPGAFRNSIYWVLT